MEKIEETLKNDVTKFSNSLYIRVPLDREIESDLDILEINRKIKTIEDLDLTKLDLIDWFKEKQNYSNYINSNKAVSSVCDMFPKIITTCHQYAVFFNTKTVTKKLKDNKKYQEIIPEDLYKIFITEFIGIFHNKVGYIADYLKATDYVKKYFNAHSNHKIKVKLFLDVDTDKYKEAYNKYVKENMFDQNTQKETDGITKGRASFFYSLNTKKPYLSHMLKTTNEVNLCTEKEANEIFILNKYTNTIFQGQIPNKIGVGNIKYNFNPKVDKIIQYSVNPYNSNKELKKTLTIKNYMQIYKWKESEITKYNQVKALIFKFTDKEFLKYDDQKKTFDLIFKNKIWDLEENTFDMFVCNYKKMIKLIYRMHKYTDDEWEIAKIINFDISMSDYINNTSKGEKTNKMAEVIRTKIKTGEAYVIESDEEFYFLVGQLAKYLKCQTRTKIENKTNALLINYLNANNVNRIMDVLRKDKVKLDYNVKLEPK